MASCTPNSSSNLSLRFAAASIASDCGKCMLCRASLSDIRLCFLSSVCGRFSTICSAAFAQALLTMVYIPLLFSDEDIFSVEGYIPCIPLCTEREAAFSTLSISGCTIDISPRNIEGLPNMIYSLPTSMLFSIHFIPLNQSISAVPVASDTKAENRCFLPVPEYATPVTLPRICTIVELCCSFIAAMGYIFVRSM